MSSEINDRLNHIEFRQELLFNNSNFDRYLFECNVTRNQLSDIHSLFAEYRSKIGNNEEVSSPGYEQQLYLICPSHEGDYHFAELIAQLLHEERRYDEVFETLYGEMPKFQSYLSKKSE